MPYSKEFLKMVKVLKFKKVVFNFWIFLKKGNCWEILKKISELTIKIFTVTIIHFCKSKQIKYSAVINLAGIFKMLKVFYFKVTNSNNKIRLVLFYFKLVKLSYSKLIIDNNQTIIVLGQSKSCIWPISWCMTGNCNGQNRYPTLFLLW